MSVTFDACPPTPTPSVDAAIVLVGYAAFSSRVGQYTALRLLRIMRWLYRISGIRLVLSACYESLPGLQGVAILNIMSLLVRRKAPRGEARRLHPHAVALRSRVLQVFSLIGLELWSGVMGGMCGYYDPNLAARGVRQWVWDSAEAPCALPCDGACVVSRGDSCGFASGVFNASTGDPAVVPMQVCFALLLAHGGTIFADYSLRPIPFAVRIQHTAWIRPGVLGQHRNRVPEQLCHDDCAGLVRIRCHVRCFLRSRIPRF